MSPRLRDALIVVADVVCYGLIIVTALGLFYGWWLR